MGLYSSFLPLSKLIIYLLRLKYLISFMINFLENMFMKSKDFPRMVASILSNEVV